MGRVSSAAASSAAAEAVVDLGHDVYQIDTFMAGYSRITAGYLIRGDRPCLVETGTAPSAPLVREALASLGVGPADLATVVVTHIHLDHAGGTGDIAGMFPGAEVVVHERGARHLADPTRLMASARSVWGDELDQLFGTLAPTPAERIRTVDRTGTIDLGGGRRLDCHYAPGHARHHVALIDSVSGDLYVGDAAGIYIPDTGSITQGRPVPAGLLVTVRWPQGDDDRMDGSAWSAVIRTGQRVLRVLRRVLPVLLVGQVVEDDRVEFLEPLRGVGRAVGIGRSGPPEPLASLVLAPRVQERVGVGVEQPCGFRSPSAVGQLGDLQRGHGCLGESLIPANP
jgi:glyoxylase-like metal-dependent hydrolase (beta-lactamase superfamily II)